MAICGTCGATVSGPPGAVACKYCGARVDIPLVEPPPQPPPDPRPAVRDEIEADPFVPRYTPPGSNPTGIIIGVSIASFVFLAIVAGALAESKHKAKAKVEGSHLVATAAPAKTAAAPPRFTTLARTATVTSSTGAVPFTEKTCDMRVWPVDRSDECRVWLSCGKLRVYGSAHNWIKCGPSTGAPSFVADPDPTTTDGDAQLHADFVANTATLSDSDLAGDSYSVSFALAPTTAPQPQGPPDFDPVTLNLAVTSKVGGVPFSGSRCSLTISALQDPDLCRAVLLCDGRTIYGSRTSTTRCEADDKGPVMLLDYQPTPKDNDAKLLGNLRRGDVQLADTTRSGNSYLVTFKVKKQGS